MHNQQGFGGRREQKQLERNWRDNNSSAILLWYYMLALGLNWYNQKSSEPRKQPPGLVAVSGGIRCGASIRGVNIRAGIGKGFPV